MFHLKWADRAEREFGAIQATARRDLATREKQGRRKSTKAEGLCKQITKALDLLRRNPRHPGLQTHPYQALQNPYGKDEKVFVAYAQQNTPSAYRIFWCYGPQKGQITIVAITPHPGH